MKKRTSLYILVISLASLALAVPVEKYFDIAKNLDIFATLFREVNAYYVDEIEPTQLIQTGIQGMLSSLDPYTDYIPEEDLEAFSILTTGQYAGIGALITSLNEKNIITHPYENFPAFRAGVRVGDEIVSVNGNNMRGKTPQEVSTLLKGNPDSEVTLVVIRSGREFTFRLTRERIKISNVSYQDMVEPGVGYIKLDDFTPDASREVQEAVISLKQKGASKIILDLRDNPGGLLHEAVNIVNLFIPKGREVVATKGRVKDWNKTYTTLNPPLDLKIPLVVITNGSSASASEIVAGALQDYDRAVIVGQKTFGKGLVQMTRPLAFNAQLKVTTAKYYIPSGRCIQALDYTHRKQDGSVEKIVDSLRNAFQTKSGRTVYDGSGLDPDLPVAREPYGSAVLELVQSGLIFDYATRYCDNHTSPTDFRKFQLSDSEYKEFEGWLSDKKFEYTTALEKQVDDLMVEAKLARNYDDLQENLQTVKSKITLNHSGYLRRFRDEIQPILEAEIGFHTQLNKGRTEASMHHDPELLEAGKILGDGAAYQKLLMPH
ncbi:MAG: S41 family peptidase [Cytophagales bacterium]|nr:S41 family peptidase [Cytophagales bacterium]